MKIQWKPFVLNTPDSCNLLSSHIYTFSQYFKNDKNALLFAFFIKKNNFQLIW